MLDFIERLSKIFGDRPGFFAFISGVCFFLLLLLMSLFVHEPSQFQWLVFKALIALAGAGFAASIAGVLEIDGTIPGTSVKVKAAAGFAVFFMLLYYSPAELAVPQSKRAAIELKREFVDSNSRTSMAYRKLEAIFETPEYVELDGKASAEALPVDKHKSAIDGVDRFITNQLSKPDNAAAFNDMNEFYLRIAQCLKEGGCDAEIICSEFFSTVERHRWGYCSQLKTWDKRNGHDVAGALKEFSENRCRRQYLSKYVSLAIKNGDTEFFCLPKICWSSENAERVCAASSHGPKFELGAGPRVRAAGAL